MKIYNEIITIFNDETQQWDTLYEDSYNYSDQVMLLRDATQAELTKYDTNFDGVLDQADADALRALGGMGVGLANEVEAIMAAPEPEIVAETLAKENFAKAQNVSGRYPLDLREGFDKITETVKTTAGYFTNGDGTLGGNDVYTGSLSSTNEKYYFNIVQTHPTSSIAETQFSVAYGHIYGSGSDTKGGTGNASTLKGETEAIYEQFTSLLLESSEISGGFKISQQGSDGAKSSGEKDEDIYVLVGKRARFKDRMNKKSWTIRLKGLTTDGSTSSDAEITLTDDSANVSATTTPAGPRYNIVSGSVGSVSGSGYTHKTYGHFYSEMGVLVFSAAELSASIPGIAAGTSMTASFLQIPSEAGTNAISTSGFAPNIDNNGDCKNALRFVNCLRNTNTSTALRFRSEEDQTQINYFCRAKSGQSNHSNNPTFVSGSNNEIRNADMRGNPQTFISGVGLYNVAGVLVAVAKLSSPLKKNFASEATIKVKLTF